MSLNSEQKDILVGMINKIVSPMGVVCDVSVREETAGGKEVIVASIDAPEDARFLIGKNGQNLQALEHIVRSMFFKAGTHDQPPALFVDVNDYRKSRATQVSTMAHEAVARVRNTQKAEVLLPMSPYERRVVHMELASFSDIATESIGQEPQRRIVVKPYKISN